MVVNVENNDVWHALMSHVHVNILKILLVSIQHKVMDACDSCHLAKQYRLVFFISEHLRNCLFDLIHADLWGPYRFTTHDDCNMFLTLVEDKSRAT